jgi:hypothetical protein
VKKRLCSEGGRGRPPVQPVQRPPWPAWPSQSHPVSYLNGQAYPRACLCVCWIFQLSADSSPPPQPPPPPRQHP